VSLTNISLKRFRCFDDLRFDLSPGINFFHGSNGSGKTTILESIFMFSSGKSFKSSNLSSLIKYNNTDFYLKAFDSETGHIVEIKKEITKPISVLLNNTKITTSRLIRIFPCTVIHNNTFSFADASPDFRRKLLDRSIFVADENFSSNWFSFYRALKQRNSLLKSGSVNEISIWNEAVSKKGELLTEQRENYFKQTLTEFNNLIEVINPENVFVFLKNIRIKFYKGWHEDINLLNTLSNNINLDLKRRSTIFGPHKADIKFLINDIDARQLLSRGEQKFFSIMWCCAQNEVLKKSYGVKPTLIIDDIKSELDEKVFQLLMNLLKLNRNQVIFSCIDDYFSSKITSKFNDFKKFHVEQLG